MGKLNSQNYNPSRPKLAPDDLEGTAAILTIASAEEIDVQDPNRSEGFRKALVMNFEETEDKALWPNATMTQTLILMLGDDTDEWVGKTIPVEARNVRYNGETHHKVCILEGREWKGAYGEAGVTYPYKSFAPTTKAAAPKKAASKPKKR
jgi:hypothetical protein